MPGARSKEQRLTPSQRLTWQLRERIKELDALHRSARLLQSPGRPTSETMKRLLRLLPKAWQYPDMICLRIDFDGSSYTTQGYKRTPWRQAARFSVKGGGRGILEVCYRRRPPGPGRAFLPEETRLLSSVSGLLQSYFARNRVEQRLLAAKADLQQRVANRTRQLRKLNWSLRAEIAERGRNERQIRRYQARLKLLALQLAMFEEQERREIAADLHDHIGQNLMMIKLKISQLKATAPDAGTAKSLEEIGGLLDRTINYTRDLNFEVMPPVLYELGLAPALEWLADHFREKHGLEVAVRGGTLPLGMDRKLLFVLYMAVRELLFNVVKHASATRAEVSLASQGQVVRITVEDDGRGFDAASAERKASATRGYGLFGTREKLHYFSGRLEVESSEGRGTRVIIEVPVVKEGET